MPILYVHGVNTRSRDGFFAIQPYLKRYLSSTISDDPDHVLIDDVYWGDIAAQFAWDGASRPRTRLLGQGATDAASDAIERLLAVHAHAEVLKHLPATPSPAPTTGDLITGGIRPTPSLRLRLRELTPNQLSDLIATVIVDTTNDSVHQAQLVIAADEAATDPQTQTDLACSTTIEDELLLVVEHVRRRIDAKTGLLSQGAPTWMAKLRDRLGETIKRADDLPAYAFSTVTAELRPWLNDFISVFLGDVFAYIAKRGDWKAPGDIPQRFLSKFHLMQENKQRRGGEPLVVISHSMGGQVVYDAVTHFLRADQKYQNQRIDFWCATASQVGFFEEMKLFLEHDPVYRSGNPVPFPYEHLGMWWNIWDHNDFLSFTGADIFQGVIDEPYNSGMSFMSAHGGYLQRPSFFRALAAKLRIGAAQGWMTP